LLKNFDLVKKSFNSINIGIYGLVSIALMFIFMISAYLHFPGYKIFLNVVSVLGLGEGGIFFNIGLIISGIFLIPFFFKYNSYYTINSEKKMKNLTKILGLISSSSYLLLGFFPIHFFVHYILVFNIFFIGMIDLIIINNIILKQTQYSKLMSIPNLILIFSVISYLIMLLFVYHLHAIAEWITVFAFGFWVVINSSYFILAKSKHSQ